MDDESQQDSRREKLVAQARGAHEKYLKANRSALSHAREIGQALELARAENLMSKGVAAFVAEHFTFTRQWANRCMRLAAKWAVLEQARAWHEANGISSDDVGVDRALRLIREFEQRHEGHAASDGSPPKRTTVTRVDVSAARRLVQDVADELDVLVVEHPSLRPLLDRCRQFAEGDASAARHQIRRAATRPANLMVA